MQNLLYALTSIVDYLGLCISLWLAFYLLARGFPSPITRRAVIVLLALSVFFLSASLNLHVQIPGTTAVRAVMLTIGLAIWCDLTQRLLPQADQRRGSWIVIGIYGLAGITVILLIGTQDAFVQEQTNLLYVGRMQLGYQYTVYGITEVITAIAILYNLQSGRKARVGQPNPYFTAGTLLAVCTVGYGSLALALTPPMPRIIQDALIAGGIVWLGISIARHQTLVEHRITLHELPVYTMAIFSLAGVYASIAWLWIHSAVVVILATALAVFTHSVYGLVNEILTQSLFKQETGYRTQLRQLGKHPLGEDSLPNRLEEGLKLLCEILGASGGFIAIREADEFVVAASFQSLALGEKPGGLQVSSDELYEPSEPLAQSIAWAAPAFKDGSQLALIGLGHPDGKHHYSADDLDLLVESADRVASIVALAGQRSENSGPRPNLQIESDGLMTTLITNPDPKFLKMVEEGLRNLSDVITLGQSPLARELKIDGKTHIDHGKALRQELVDAIETLRPEGTRPNEPMPREWENYVVLHDAYIEGVANREIMARLYTSEGTFNRIRRKALRGVARYLLEK